VVISTIRRVAIYARKSRDDETNEGLNIQVEQLIEKAEQEGWKYTVYKEVASSQDDRRPQWLKLRERLEDYDAILCKDADRLSRRVGFIEELQDVLQHFGIYIIYLDGTFYDPNQDDDRFKMDVKAFIGKMEYEQTKKRLKMGRERVAKSGGWCGGNPPMGYWWDKNTKSLLIKEEEAKTIRYVFQVYEELQNMLNVSDRLNLEGYTTSGGKAFEPIVVSRILKNEIYKGVITYGKTRTSKYNLYPSGAPRQIKRDSPLVRATGAHIPIIEPEQWERVNYIIRSNTNVKKPIKKARYQLSGLLRCSKCGRLLTYTKDRGDIFRVKTCQTPSFVDGVKRSCGNRSSALEQVEAKFYEELAQNVSEIHEHIQEIKVGVARKKEIPKDRKPEINARIEILKGKRETTLDLVVDGLIDREGGKERVKKIDMEISKLVHELEALDKPIEEEKPQDELERLQTAVAVLEGILKGTTAIPTCTLNEIFTAVIERVEYTRFGDNTKPLELKIVYK